MIRPLGSETGPGTAGPITATSPGSITGIIDPVSTTRGCQPISSGACDQNSRLAAAVR